MLWTIWKQTKSLDIAGYGQQDCHEWLVAALNQIHSTTANASETNCPCVAHTTFGGRLRSEVQCQKCHNVTAQQDPFLDLSLELDQAKPSASLSSCLSKSVLILTLTCEKNSNNDESQIYCTRDAQAICM